MPYRKPSPILFGLLTLAALAVILRLRLVPFEFVWDGRLPLERLTLAPLTFRDVPLNILLFVPFGFGLAGWLVVERFSAVLGRRRNPSGVEAEADRAEALQNERGTAVVLISLALSAALEAAQLFMPDRVPSLADVIANGLGALLGYGLFRAWAMGFGRALRRHVTRRNLLWGLFIYGVGVALFTFFLNGRATLRNWDPSFPLVIGNEAVGQRQWSGRVEELTISSGNLGLEAHYPLTGAAPFEDVVQLLGVPPLVWQEGPATPQDGQGVIVGPGEWLATDGSFAPLSEDARRTNNLLIEMRVTTAARDQRGPARIVSISADAEHRNVTLGQVGDKLVIRLRTPTAGENGQKPEILVPNVFTDTTPRHIWVTYDAPMLRVTVDRDNFERAEYELSLAPGAAFFPGFATENRWQITMSDDAHYYDRRYWALVAGLPLLLTGGLLVARGLVGKGNEFNTDFTDDTDS